jgi:hypothetical protein
MPQYNLLHFLELLLAPRLDADGKFRLCLRIRGLSVPRNYSIDNMFDEENIITKRMQMMYSADKTIYCKGCNHTCLLMSQYINETEKGKDELVHIDKRG